MITKNFFISLLLFFLIACTNVDLSNVKSNEVGELMIKEVRIDERIVLSQEQIKNNEKPKITGIAINPIIEVDFSHDFSGSDQESIKVFFRFKDSSSSIEFIAGINSKTINISSSNLIKETDHTLSIDERLNTNIYGVEYRLKKGLDIEFTTIR